MSVAISSPESTARHAWPQRCSTRVVLLTVAGSAAARLADPAQRSQRRSESATPWLACLADRVAVRGRLFRLLTHGIGAGKRRVPEECLEPAQCHVCLREA